MMPGRVNRASSFQSTLRWAIWLIPETQVVKVSTVWTPADAAAGATPRLISSVVQMPPNAIPNAPSTPCAAMPTATKGSRSARLKPPSDALLDFNHGILLAEERLQDKLGHIVDRFAEGCPALIGAVMSVAVEDRLHMVEAVDRFAQTLRSQILKDRRRLALERLGDGR